VVLAAVGNGCSGGADGSSCTVVDDGAGTATITCDDGTTATVGSGTNGMDGTSCTVADDGMGTKTISCDDGTTVTVVDGVATPGDPGRNAMISGAGLLMEVMESGVDATTRIPYAVLRFTDVNGDPIDREGLFTEGAVSASFTVAHLPPPVPRTGSLPDIVLPWENYITATVTATGGTDTATQPKTDSMGTWTDIDAEDGTYRYDFGAVLPADYSTTDTHRIGIYATRTFDGVRYVANAEPTFRPDGMAVTVTRDVVSNDGCNTCHSPLSAHGGSREDTELCVTCHTDGMADPESGNTIDFRTMVHRIHRGASLPSVQAGETYEIVGFRGSVHDFSDIHFPQDIRNCQTCHTGTDGDRWNSNPSRAACGSCHDDVYFETGTPPQAWMIPHPGGVPVTDAMCTTCHVEGGLEPVTEAHRTKFQQPYASDIVVTINSSSLTSGRQLMVDFTVTVDGAGRDVVASPFRSFTAVVAGPTTDYRLNTTYNMATTGTLVAGGTAGNYTWTSPDTVDDMVTAAQADPFRDAPGITASGTWALGLQASLRNNGPATTIACTGSSTGCPSARPEGGRWGCVSSVCVEQYDYAAPNPITYIAITDTTPVPRREVVEMANCNACHQQLGLHGGSRNNPELCVMCHNPINDNADRLSGTAGTTAVSDSISFANFVHSIHTGEHGDRGDTQLFDFSEVRFPADRRACDTCHVSLSTAQDVEGMQSLYAVRTREVTLGTSNTINETFLQGATASACTGCHDSVGAIAHAEIMTTAMGVEACSTCHAAGNAYGVDTVHARPEYDIR
jgi:OmcA/MtrC family decaheme c-type cytochrome